MCFEKLLVFVVVVLVSVRQSHTQETIYITCDPRVEHRTELCPEGYCCVRDEFLPSETYCKKIGFLDDNCTTRTTESDCPCIEGLECRPNIMSANFMSIYGTCVNATENV